MCGAQEWPPPASLWLHKSRMIRQDVKPGGAGEQPSLSPAPTSSLPFPDPSALTFPPFPALFLSSSVSLVADVVFFCLFDFFYSVTRFIFFSISVYWSRSHLHVKWKTGCILHQKLRQLNMFHHLTNLKNIDGLFSHFCCALLLLDTLAQWRVLLGNKSVQPKKQCFKASSRLDRLGLTWVRI